jgi:SAM-dependent methyltransferase
MNEQIHREQVVHGSRWNAVHDGYFSDPGVARPLVAKARELAARTQAATVVDLGGGTGFVLSQLRASGLPAGIQLVNLDDSAVQLEAARTAGFTCLQQSVDAFARKHLPLPDARCLFVMRSVLHYFGQDGLRPVLRHLRAQLRPGEYFVHQTASFSCSRDARCLNNLYTWMRTPKWYPTVRALRRTLRDEGWQVVEIGSALPLRLKDDDLQLRYHLDDDDLRRIRSRLARCTRVPPDVAQTSPSGFCAFLHYWIYVCTPAPDTAGTDAATAKRPCRRNRGRAT